MAQCQNFFDDKSPSVCKSTSSNEQQLSPCSTTIDGNTEGDDRHLELRLSLLMGASKPKQHEMVRPIPLYPSIERQRSGNHGNATSSSPLFRGHSDTYLVEKALFSSKDSAFSTPSISHEQVWQSLQNSNAAMVHESCTPKAALCDDAASFMLAGRRSSSMQQLLMPSNETSDAGACAPIKRSCSNGMALSRQLSFGQESHGDENLETINSLAHHNQQDALERQKKKEMQAHRRLEARKRRRLLLDKQQKKARQSSGPNNRQTVSPVEKVSPVRMRSLDAKYSLDSKDFYKCMDIKRESQVRDADAGLTPPPVHGGSEEKHNSRNECESTSSGSKGGLQGELSSVRQMIASCDLSGHSGCKEDRTSAQAGKNAEICDATKMLRSSCSETESSETKEKEADLSERESSSQKSSTENHFDYGVSSTANPSGKPMPYPQNVHGFPSVNAMVQANSSLCRAPRFPATKFGRDEGFLARQLSHRRKISELLSTKVPSSFTIKRSVGVFSEGKWRIPNEDSAFPAIRRTASSINEAVPETPRCSAKTYASLSASQLKFAGMVFNNASHSSSRMSGNNLRRGFSNANEKDFRKELDVFSREGKASIFNAMGSGRVGETFAPMKAPIKVKQEEDVMDNKVADFHFARDPLQGPVVPKMEVEPIKGQTDASFSELPQVTTTGRGPNGRTINGFMYMAGGRAVRLVCRCHGKDMSPAEFVEHAGSTDLSNPLRSIKVNSFLKPNHLASTPV
ncbi:hypothetical protein GOP47_0022267 [Adiantum capillus-veneris]|uniref:Tify domain-containing protein n=1 Tax=Adiantum capillus-veneris TaxID=13818 RepID=A0A9D4U9M5_ADICA|nr:hypothetical protein GOP47_0022267 [Adiantum capillus-veneris]